MMLDAMNQLTDKPEWRRKVFDETIVLRWWSEVVNDQGPQYRREPLNGKPHGFTNEMFDYCIDELRANAKMFENTGMVMVLDVGASVVKSDSIIDEELRLELINAAKPLEEVPDNFKDWHPGSDGKVLDLVHPSLFPLVYGRTKILPHREIGLDDCLVATGSGEVIPRPSDDETVRDSVWYNRKARLWSNKFQWLPCEVKFAGDGVKITSYINNLHPVEHKNLYSVIEKVMAKAIPLWSCTMEGLAIEGDPRIDRVDGFKYPEDGEQDFPGHAELDDNMPDDRHEEINTVVTSHDWEEDEYDYNGDRTSEDEEEDRLLHMPQPHPFKPEIAKEWPDDDHLQKEFANEGFQVIVKLANIVLTPEKPTYDGGSWHVEGQLNEKICATALYYYDCENVTDSYLAFRHQIIEDDLRELPGQGDYGWVEYLYGIRQDAPTMQERGRILTRQGRLLAFPNVFQHRVAPFSLADRTKPGHRKILALFLVDPNHRIISTANVPPQQRHWWADSLYRSGALSALPAELIEAVVDAVDEPMGMDKAKELREELMEERKGIQGVFHNEVISFSFCEH
ncbi:uncharacterized protein K452DRAFT_260906 [Aplosporella prunicola CBS 121167]|uniref:Uncharacterized protein n=1 Tax=Aplosporella prunicola CBS 121167 TaxID=1176127 RepID=A0A6A6ATE0_9PEZI|nr:uncharacterized protein K452DRAFT_260906 [Aplosporella prunicola CBS 121167]KAF2135272.1 hypothetical protein K452DRAFT_260906 [Aplosporella prunicola CBS 121167]